MYNAYNVEDKTVPYKRDLLCLIIANYSTTKLLRNAFAACISHPSPTNDS